MNRSSALRPCRDGAKMATEGNPADLCQPVRPWARTWHSLGILNISAEQASVGNAPAGSPPWLTPTKQGECNHDGVRRRPWRLVGSLGLEEMRPLLRAAGHELWTPTYTGLGKQGHCREPDHESRHPNCRRHRHARDGGSARRRADRAQLRRHWWRPASPNTRAHRAGRVSRRVHTHDGQNLCDLQSAGRARACANSRAPTARAGGCRQPRCRRTRRCRRGLGVGPQAAAADQDVRAALASRRQRPAASPQLHHSQRCAPADGFRQFAKRAQHESGWRYFEIDASHNPHITHRTHCWNCSRRSYRRPRSRLHQARAIQMPIFG